MEAITAAEVISLPIEGLVVTEGVDMVETEVDTMKMDLEMGMDAEAIEEEEGLKEEEVSVVVDKEEECLEGVVVVENSQVIQPKILAEELLQDLAVRTMPVGGTTITEEGVEATMVRMMIMMDHTGLKDLVEIQLRIIQRDFEEGKIHITSVNHKIKVNRRWNHRRVAVGGNGKWQQ